MKVDYTPLAGGLDLISSAMAVKPGRVQQSRNFEQVFGKQGYRRIDGYERFDGRPEPHKAAYTVLPFRLGTYEILAGDMVTTLGASADVVAVVLESGAWASGTAAGLLILLVIDGAWTKDATILRSGVQVATAADASYLGRAATSGEHRAYKKAAAERRRGLIAKPPGSGPILGLAVFEGLVIAARNASDGLTSSLWRSSSSGWVLVRSGLLPSERYEFCVANFSGDSRRIALYGCNGRNSPFVYDGVGFKEMEPIYGTQSKSATSHTISTGSKLFSLTGTARAFTVGMPLVIYSSSTGAHMTGAVTAYTHPSLTVSVTSVVGSGTLTDWRIGRADYEDAPYLLTAHRDHLYLAYPRGQLQASNTGDPLTYTTTAALFGLGDEITGLVSLKGAVLGVFCEDKISLLEGSSQDDWSMSTHAQGLGARQRTTQENAGNALMLCDRGLFSLQATQSFGFFEPSNFSRDVQPLLDGRLQDVRCSRLVRGKYQYRAYLGDGTVLSACVMTPNPVVQPSDVAFMVSRLNHAVYCTAQGRIGGEDAMFFGTEDGWVMREDVGTSMDGEPIEAVIRLHSNHFGSPSQRKRFHKMTLELDSPDSVEISFRRVFDYSDGVYAASPIASTTTPGVGGQWNAGDWDSFYWSLPSANQVEANVDGVAGSVSLLLWTGGDGDESVTLQGILTHFSALGIKR